MIKARCRWLDGLLLNDTQNNPGRMEGYYYYYYYYLNSTRTRNFEKFNKRLIDKSFKFGFYLFWTISARGIDGPPPISFVRLRVRWRQSRNIINYGHRGKLRTRHINAETNFDSIHTFGQRIRNSKLFNCGTASKEIASPRHHRLCYCNISYIGS